MIQDKKIVGYVHGVEPGYSRTGQLSVANREKMSLRAKVQKNARV